MTTREWLNRGYQLSRRLEIKKAYRDSLANVISRYETSESQSDHTRNVSEDTFIRWSETQREIEQMELKLRNIDTATDEIIRKIENSDEYVVLFCRYIRRLPWSEVANVVGYSSQHVYRLHADGVKACDNYMESVNFFALCKS